jgi:hypothetical protein
MNATEIELLEELEVAVEQLMDKHKQVLDSLGLRMEKHVQCRDFQLSTSELGLVEIEIHFHATEKEFYDIVEFNALVDGKLERRVDATIDWLELVLDDVVKKRTRQITEK